MADDSYSKKPPRSRAELLQNAGTEEKPVTRKEKISSGLSLLAFVGFFMSILYAVDHIGLSPEHAKVAGAVAVFGGGLLMVTVCGTVGFLPLLLSAKGRTKEALGLAQFNSKVMTLIAPKSSETAGLYLTVAKVARDDANYDLSEQFARRSIEAAQDFNQALIAYRERMLKSAKKSPLDSGVELARVSVFTEPEAQLILAWTLYEVGRHDEAEEAAKQSMYLMRAAIEGETNPAKQWDKSDPKNIVDILNYDFTKKLAEKTAKATVKSSMPFNLALLANTYDLLAEIAARKGDSDQARRFIRDSFNTVQDNMLGDTVHAITHHQNKACSLLYLGDARAAKTECELALQLANKHKPSQSLYSSTYTVLGEACRQLNMKQEAEEYLKKAVAIREKIYPQNHPYLAETRHYLARTYKDMGRKDDAKVLLEQSISGTQLTLPATHIDVSERRRELAQVGGRIA
jgi:tetratricopeptide (TPR) repeat protein